MLFGTRGRGKTWVALGMATAMSSGVKFLKHGPANPRRVIYLDGEMDLVTFQQRIKALCTSLGIELPPGLRLFTPEAFADLLPSINTPEGQRVCVQRRALLIWCHSLNRKLTAAINRTGSVAQSGDSWHQ